MSQVGRVLEWVTVAISMVVALLMLGIPGYIWALTLTAAEGSPASGLLTVNTVDVNRLDDDSPGTLALRLSRVLIPAPDLAGRPSAVILVPGSTWQVLAAVAPLIRLTGSPILVNDGPAVRGEIRRLNPSGISTLGGSKVIAVNTVAPAGRRVLRISANDPADLAAAVDQLRARLPGGEPRNVFLVPDDPGFALPAAYWAAYSGDALLFLGRSGTLPVATKDALARRGGTAHVYIMGSAPPSELARYGTSTRIGGDDPVRAAVDLAQFRDRSNDVGWGLDGTRWASDHAFVLANPATPLLAAVGIPLGRLGEYGPLLWTAREHLSAATDQYLWKMKPQYFMTPAEGPYNSIWLLGRTDRIAYTTQGEADLTQQIEAYRFAGPGLSGFEVLWVLWIVWGITAGVWLVAYSVARLPEMGPVATAGWGLLGLALGPVALWLFRRVYHHQRWVRHGGMVRFVRSGFSSTLAASAMNRSFDGPLMLVLSWLLLFRGLPTVVLHGPLFWVGNPMFCQIVIVYALVFSLHWLVMHAGMVARHEGLGYLAAARRAFQPAFYSMTAMTIGMMGFMWWIQMINLMTEHMARDDDVMWWGTAAFGIFVGFVVALPIDHWLVRCHRQPGIA